MAISQSKAEGTDVSLIPTSIYKNGPEARNRAAIANLTASGFPTPPSFSSRAPACNYNC